MRGGRGRQPIRRSISWVFQKQGLKIGPKRGGRGKMYVNASGFALFLGRMSEMFACRDAEIHEYSGSRRADVSFC